MADHTGASEDNGRDTEMGGAGWEGVPAGTSGSAAPGTEGAGEGEPSAPPRDERPTRRGHEDVGDAAGEAGMVGKAPAADAGGRIPGRGSARGDPQAEAPADAGLGVHARGRNQGQATGVGTQATAGPGRAAGPGSAAGASGVGDQSRDLEDDEESPGR